MSFASHLPAIRPGLYPLLDAGGESAHGRRCQVRYEPRRSDFAAPCTVQSLRYRSKPSPSRLVCGPFTDPSFHLLVRDEPALFDVAFRLAYCSEKGNLIGSVAIIDVIRKTIDR